MNWNEIFYIKDNFLYRKERFDRANSWNTRYANKPVNTKITASGYLRVSNKNIGYTMVHRIIWEMTNGDIPDGLFIDHINGDRSDNRIDNLRLVTKLGNSMNSSIRKDNKTGIVGVAIYKRTGKWRASINFKKNQMHLGFFDNFISACEARIVAEVSMGYHPNHGK